MNTMRHTGIILGKVADILCDTYAASYTIKCIHNCMQVFLPPQYMWTTLAACGDMLPFSIWPYFLHTLVHTYNVLVPFTNHSLVSYIINH